MPNRRDFVRALALTTAACAMPQGAGRPDGAAAGGPRPNTSPNAGGGAGGRRLDRVGVQLYTLRRALDADVDGTLARVARIGYAEVETAGYHGRTPAAFRRALDAHNLRAAAAHVPLGDVRDKTAATLDTVSTLGARYVVVPWIDPAERRTADQYRGVADALNRAGEAARARGLGVAYHNHDFELEPLAGGATRGLDVLLERTDPALVSFEMDLYWVTKAGGDPLAYFARWPGRFTMVHVKDSKGAPAHEMTSVGDGSIDFAGIFARRDQAGIRHFFVEHDNPADPLASIEASYRALRELTF